MFLILNLFLLFILMFVNKKEVWKVIINVIWIVKLSTIINYKLILIIILIFKLERRGAKNNDQKNSVKDYRTAVVR